MASGREITHAVGAGRAQAVFPFGVGPGIYAAVQCHTSVREDSKGRGLFDKSTDRVFANPFYGEPADTTLQKGVWFYEKEGLYHLQWNGLAVSDSLDIFFDSGAFGETCLASDGVRNLDNGCKVVEKVSDFTSMQSSAGAYLSDYPIWQFPTYTDRVMTLSGTGGHVAMRSSGMFRIAGRSTLGNSDVPVYFGSGNYGAEAAANWYFNKILKPTD